MRVGSESWPKVGVPVHPIKVMDAGGEAEMDFNTTEERQEQLIDSITILLCAPQNSCCKQLPGVVYSDLTF